MELDFQAISDEPSGTALELVFEEYWPAYRRWMSKSTIHNDTQRCVQQLREHMPDIASLCERLHTRFGGTDEIARFLTLYDPPRIVRACTQLVFDSAAGPRLLRTYDHHPRLFDGLILSSRWNGTDTLVMADCLWGALDGINEHGLTIALAFGGRNVVGHGFAAPLICRYVLETCATLSAARDVLERVPVYMPYTFVVLDRSGEFVTAFLGPDRPASFVTRRASSNHQGAIEWAAYARSTESGRRLDRAESLLRQPHALADIRQAFLEPPIWRHDYAKASGTLYTAEYTPANKSLDLHWPDHSEHFVVGRLVNQSFSVTLPAKPRQSPS